MGLPVLQRMSLAWRALEWFEWAAFQAAKVHRGAVGSEFLPHLDEGGLWVRGTFAPSTGPTEGIRIANQARVMLCSFPEVLQCTSQVGRPDDGTDTTGFFNTEYFVDLKQK
jgi:cobalt-zinc-cadmium resistance protein CzcA